MGKSSGEDAFKNRQKQHRKRMNRFAKDIEETASRGEISQNTLLELREGIALHKQAEKTGKGGKDVPGFRSFDDLVKDFLGEKEGTTNKGKSRLATQKLFETLVDQPGRKQTLLTPRSNASRGILGV